MLQSPQFSVLRATVALLVVGVWMAFGVGSSRAAQVSFTETSSIPLCDGQPVCGSGQMSTDPAGGVLADLTGHRSRDLVIAQPGGVAVMLGDGSGGFSAPEVVPGSPAPAFGVASGHLRGRGATDVVVGTSSGITIMRADHHSGLKSEQSIGLGGTTTDLNLVPLDGHGPADIVALVQPVTGGSYVVVLVDRGGGRFSDPIQINVNGDASGLAVADINHDGIPDLIVNDYPYVTVLLGQGRGHFGPPRDTPASPLGAGSAVYVGDLTGDGNPDALVGGYLYPGDGAGNLGSPVYVFDAHRAESVDALGDFNGDGHLDIATYDSVILGNGDGTFQPAVPIPSPGIPPRFGPVQLITTDFGGDGGPGLIRLGRFHESGRPFVGEVDVLKNTSH